MNDKLERALEIIMNALGKPYWCASCEDWFGENHFADKHIQK